MYGVCNGLGTSACEDGLAATTPSSGVTEHDWSSLSPLFNFIEKEFEQAGLLQVNGLRPQLGLTSSGASSGVYQHVQNEESSDSAGAGRSSRFHTSVPSATQAVQLRVPDGPDLENDPPKGHSPRTACSAQQHASHAVPRKRLNSQHQKRFRLRQKVADPASALQAHIWTENRLSTFLLCDRLSLSNDPHLVGESTSC